MDRSEFAWYWIDEPGEAKWRDVCDPASRLLKKVDPEMLTWEDPSPGVTDEQLEDSLPYFDMYCPNLGHIDSPTVLDICHRTNLRSWYYACASEKNSSPFAYYRWFSWNAWEMQLGGIGMWVYVDDNGMTFSDYTTGVSYGLIYRGDKGVIGSKRWDAWRQGIADYEYLRMLTDALAAAKQAGENTPAMRTAQRILDGGVAEVVGEDPHGGQSENMDVPDRYRLEILECLAAMQ